MSCIIDASVAVSWCFEEEQTPAALELLKEVTASEAFAPCLWPFEVQNAIRIAHRRRRCTEDERKEYVVFLEDLPINIDPETLSYIWTTTARLADILGLTIYDAAYLELAHRLSLPLATFDQELIMAAKMIGVPLVLAA